MSKIEKFRFNTKEKNNPTNRDSRQKNSFQKNQKSSINKSNQKDLAHNINSHDEKR